MNIFTQDLRFTNTCLAGYRVMHKLRPYQTDPNFCSMFEICLSVLFDKFKANQNNASTVPKRVLDDCTEIIEGLSSANNQIAILNEEVISLLPSELIQIGRLLLAVSNELDLAGIRDGMGEPAKPPSGGDVKKKFGSAAKEGLFNVEEVTESLNSGSDQLGGGVTSQDFGRPAAVVEQNQVPKQVQRVVTEQQRVFEIPREQAVPQNLEETDHLAENAQVPAQQPNSQIEDSQEQIGDGGLGEQVQEDDGVLGRLPEPVEQVEVVRETAPRTGQQTVVQQLPDKSSFFDGVYDDGFEHRISTFEFQTNLDQAEESIGIKLPI